MPDIRSKSHTLTFFQIHKDGYAIEGDSYPTLEQASAALERAGQGGEVTEVDATDRITRRYTLEESRAAARKFRHDTRATGHQGYE
jgi:hypothetical protein